MNLINKKLLLQKIATHEFPNSERLENARKLLEGWQKALKDSDLEKTKEKSVQGKFLSTFFEAILGYSDVTTGNEEWTLIQHPRIENDSKEPDGSLGWFTKDKKITRAVIELKDAKTQLDKKQNRGSEKLTPIEQAYLYATKYDGCNWIIVSNFKEIRLYNKHKTQEYYEKFDVVDLVEENEFKRFYFLLSKDTLLTKDKESIIDVLAKDTVEAEQDITKKFYAEYKHVRLNLLQHLIDNNPTIEKDVLLEKAQKLLDRFIFTLFCEDTSSLLPLNIVKGTYERALNSLSPSDERVWTEFRGLFIAIDKGNDRVKPPINAYNGGLFAYDEILDRLSVKDDFWTELMRLAEYDFETDLNVNILGHIFEQSISDLESIKSELLGEEQDKKKSKRKKDGIFYTPEYITRYIVENTVGKYLEEHPDKLSTIKILDPACGSGAFLNQAHSFLANEYKVRHEAAITEKQSRGEAITLFDYNPAESDKSILLNNLYGVDLNQESVEITKLALWLKTARKTEPLQNLDKNIKCGNSLIDDPEVAGDKAFNWNTEFKDIMDEGGFDVIIGNPPYVRSELMTEYKDYFSDHFETFQGKNDLYVYFFEQSLNLLKDGGYMAFIVSSKFTKTNYARTLRKFLLENSIMLEFVDFNDLEIFEGITAYPAIIILRKTKTPNVSVSYKNIKQVPLNTVDIYEADVTEIQYNLLTESEWLFSRFKVKEVIEKNKDLVEFTKVLTEPKVGIKTGFNDAFLISNESYNLLPNEIRVLYRKYVLGRDINKYTINPRHWIFFPYKLNTETNLLDIDRSEVNTSIIHEYRDQLERRAIIKDGLINDSKVWYEYQQINKAFNFEKKYIAYPNVSNDSKFALVTGVLLDMTAFYIEISQDQVAYIPILNSRLIDAYHSAIAIERRGGYRENKTQYILNTKLPILDFETKQRFIGYHEKMLELVSKVDSIINNFTDLMLAEYGAKCEISKLDGFNEFLESLERNKVRLTLEQKDQLQSFYKKKKQEINVINDAIADLDLQINDEVYKLYGLTRSEIDVIEASK